MSEWVADGENDRLPGQNLPLFYIRRIFPGKVPENAHLVECKIIENQKRQNPEQIVKNQSEHANYGLREPVNSIDYLLV